MSELNGTGAGMTECFLFGEELPEGWALVINSRHVHQDGRVMVQAVKL